VTVTNDPLAKAKYDGVSARNVEKFDFPNGKSKQAFIDALGRKPRPSGRGGSPAALASGPSV
jgi:hypothetical protein